MTLLPRSLPKKSIAIAVAAVAFLGTAASAFAAPGYASANVNVRSGPGTHFHVVDQLRRGERVDIQYCRGSWCFVEKSGPDGWVSANYLDRGRPAPPRPERPDWNGPGWGHGPGWQRPPRPGHPNWHNPRPPRPPVYNPHPGGSVCFNGPNGYFCIGN